MAKKNLIKSKDDEAYKKEIANEKFVRKLLIKTIQDISDDTLEYLPQNIEEIHQERVVTSLVELKDTLMALDKYIKEQDNPTLGIDLYTIAFNFFLHGAILSKYAAPLDLIAKLSKGRKLNEDRQKDKDVERVNRRKIISENFKGKYAISKATAKEVIRKCEDKFKEAGINSFGITTIKQDLKFLTLKNPKA